MNAEQRSKYEQKILNIEKRLEYEDSRVHFLGCDRTYKCGECGTEKSGCDECDSYVYLIFRYVGTRGFPGSKDEFNQAVLELLDVLKFNV